MVVKHDQTMLHIVRHRVSESHVSSSARRVWLGVISVEGTGLADAMQAQRKKKKTAREVSGTAMGAEVDERGDKYSRGL